MATQLKKIRKSVLLEIVNRVILNKCWLKRVTMTGGLTLIILTFYVRTPIHRIRCNWKAF